MTVSLITLIANIILYLGITLSMCGVLLFIFIGIINVPPNYDGHPALCYEYYVTSSFRERIVFLVLPLISGLSLIVTSEVLKYNTGVLVELSNQQAISQYEKGSE